MEKENLDVLDKLDKIIEYQYGNRDTEQAKLVGEECRQLLQKMQLDAANADKTAKEGKEAAKQKETYKTVGSALSDAVYVIDAIRKRNKVQLVQSGLSLIMNLAEISSSPYGAAVAAICKVLLALFAISQPEKESLPSQIRKIIKEELENYKFEEVTKRRVVGWSRVGESIIDELSFYQEQCTSDACDGYKGFGADDSHRLDNQFELMAELEYLANEQFSHLAQEDSNEAKSATHCLSCLGGYANISSCYIMVLSWHIALSSQLKLSTTLLKKKLEKAERNAKDLLGFLSDRELLGPAGWWVGKLRVMKEFRGKPRMLSSIENFRKILGLSPTSYSTTDAERALNYCISLSSSNRSKLDPEFDWLEGGDGDKAFERNDNHYLFFVNNTHFPVCIFSGLVGTKQSELEFEDEVPPNESRIHGITNPAISTYFSSAGVFTVGEEKGNKRLSDMMIVQYIEFALSNPQNVWVGSNYKKILTQPVEEYSQDHLLMTYKEGLQSPIDHAKCFFYQGQMCMVQGQLKRGRDHGKGYTLYMFCIEEFDTELLKKRTSNK